MAILDDQKDAALAKLRMLVQPDTQPKLIDPELNAILDGLQRASFWEASMAFSYGDVVMPAALRNGHRYVCAEGGTTAASEPTWPTRNSAVITDGSVKWKEAGADYQNVFDIRAAAQQAWLAKEAKASELYDRGGQLYSQITEHCRRMAQSLDPVKFA
jgi:hypothetical protein